MDGVKALEISIAAIAALAPTALVLIGTWIKFQREIDKVAHQHDLVNQRIDYLEEILTRIEDNIKDIKHHGKN